MKAGTIALLIAAATFLACGGDSPTESSEYRDIETQRETARAKIADLEAQISGALDEEPPSAPRGVSVVTGDGAVTVLWLDNPEADLDGYDVLRSGRANTGFTVLASLDDRTTRYVDLSPTNGETYYYAVMAVDEAGNVSDRSREVGESTPRPQGANVTLVDSDIGPAESGFRFANASDGPIHWDTDGDNVTDDDVDIAFWFDILTWVPYFYSDHEDVYMQDLGFHKDLQSIDVVPTEGYTIIAVEALEGHVYAFIDRDGNYGKVRVTNVEPLAVTFDWAYQTQPDNPNVAPAKDAPAITVGPRRRAR